MRCSESGSSRSPSGTSKTCRVLSTVSKGYRNVSQRSSMRWLEGQKKKKCVQCLSGPRTSQRIWHLNNVLHWGKLQQEGTGTESTKNTSNIYFENEIWSVHSQFCTCFPVDTRRSILAILWLQCACCKYLFAWSLTQPRFLDSKPEGQKMYSEVL